MIADTIAQIQNLEKQICRGSPEELRARMAVRACLRDLRGLNAVSDQITDGIENNIIPFLDRAPSVIPNS